MFRLTNKLIGRDIELPCQPTEDLSVPANEFSNFFVNKIRKIMQYNWYITDISDDYLESAFETMERLTNFKLVTDQDIFISTTSCTSKIMWAGSKTYNTHKGIWWCYCPLYYGHSQHINCIRKLCQKHKTCSPQTTIEEDGLGPDPMQL